MSIIPISFDSYLGYSATAGVESQYGGVSTDPVLDSRIQGIGKRLTPNTENRNLPYRFRVLDTDSINAFALPGGPVYVNKGLLKIVNDDELASVMGHEMGHVNARHGVKGIEQSLGANIIINAITAQLKKSKGLNLSPDEINNIDKINKTLGGFVLLGYSRSDEFQADAKGLKYMANAGYNPNGAVSLMKKFQEMEGRDPTKLEVFFSTHPSSKARVDAMQKIINNNYPGAKPLVPAPITTNLIPKVVSDLWQYPAVKYGTIAGIGLAGIIISYKLLSMSYKKKRSRRNPSHRLHRLNPIEPTPDIAKRASVQYQASIDDAIKSLGRMPQKGEAYYDSIKNWQRQIKVLEKYIPEGNQPIPNLGRRNPRIPDKLKPLIKEVKKYSKYGRHAFWQALKEGKFDGFQKELDFAYDKYGSIEEVLNLARNPGPEFRSTEDALAYGQSIRGDTARINELQGLLEEALIDVEAFKRQPDPDFDEWSRAATRVQFIHEALSQVTPPPPDINRQPIL